MLSGTEIKDAFVAALPVMAGYVAIGIPCGIMEQQIGLDALQALLFSMLFYSGAGQFMIPGMFLGGASAAAILASVSAVNTRQILYSASLSKYCQDAGKRLSFFFAAGVTDETFGVNVSRFEAGKWKVSQALLVNAFSCTSWSVANAGGVLLGGMVDIPVAIGAFAMTSIFVCLLCAQRFNRVNALVVGVSMASVVILKLVGLGGPAIVLGACCGIAAGIVFMRYREHADAPA